jgi:hypothetical protein
LPDEGTDTVRIRETQELKEARTALMRATRWGGEADRREARARYDEAKIAMLDEARRALVEAGRERGLIGERPTTDR